MIRKALLFINFHKEQARSLAGEIRLALEKRGIEALNYKDDEDAPPRHLDSSFDVVFTLGGDGTVLFASRLAAPLGIPLFSINIGTLGFIAAVHPQGWEASFQAWIEGSSRLSRRMMLEAAVKRGAETVFRGNCLNDVVVAATGVARLASMSVIMCGKDKTVLGRFHYRADGIIAATPTGSTAYSAASGGPVFDPEMQAIIISPVCAFSLSNHSMAAPSDEPLVIEVEAEQRCELALSLDGQETFDLQAGDRVVICRAGYDALLIAATRLGFYQALDTKVFGGAGNVGVSGAAHA
jgi:NAD+ kinase